MNTRGRSCGAPERRYDERQKDQCTIVNCAANRGRGGVSVVRNVYVERKDTATILRVGLLCAPFVAKKVGNLVEVVVHAVDTIVRLSKVLGAGCNWRSTGRWVRDQMHVLVQESVEVVGKSFMPPEVQILFGRVSGLGVQLDHVRDHFPDILVLDSAQKRMLGLILALTILEELAQRENGGFQKQLGDHATHTEYIHGPVDPALNLRLSAGVQKPLRS